MSCFYDANIRIKEHLKADLSCLALIEFDDLLGGHFSGWRVWYSVASAMRQADQDQGP